MKKSNSPRAKSILESTSYENEIKLLEQEMLQYSTRLRDRGDTKQDNNGTEVNPSRHTLTRTEHGDAKEAKVTKDEIKKTTKDKSTLTLKGEKAEGMVENKMNLESWNERLNLPGRVNAKHTEMHLYFTPCVDTLKFFSNNSYRKLTVLVAVGQDIKDLEGLQYLVQLKELWIVECQITKIDYLYRSPWIRKLYLYSNEITEISGLQENKELEILWLAGNKISQIKNLGHLKELKELQIAQNKISSIGKSLDSNKKLEYLNLSGNPIYKLNELQNLASTSIKSLYLADPLYGACPIVQLCHYRAFAVYCLQNLNYLDSVLIYPEERSHSEELFKKKVKYYKMIKQEILSNSFHELIAKRREVFQSLSKLRDNFYMYKLLEKQESTDPSKPQNEETLDHRKTTNKVSNLQHYQAKWESMHEDIKKIKLKQMNIELESLGNVTFSEEDVKSKFGEECKKLLDMFACHNVFRELGVKECKVDRITRVVNKSLEMQFREMQCAEVSSKTSQPTFLLLASPVGAEELWKWPFELIENGLGMEEGGDVSVTNCIVLADLKWFDALSKCSVQTILETPSFKRRRVVVIVKLLPTTMHLKAQKNSSSSSRLPPEGCDTFYIGNIKGVVPQVVVEYHYVIQNLLTRHQEDCGWSPDMKTSHIRITLLMHPELDTMALKACVENHDWNLLTELNLSARGIKSIKSIPALHNVKKVDLSYNKIIAIGIIEHFPSVNHMYMSFNSIRSFVDLKSMPHLVTLDLSWNCINKLVFSLKSLSRNAKKLQNLDLSYNPIEDIIDIDQKIAYAIKYLPNVEEFNKESILLFQKRNFLENHEGTIRSQLRKKPVEYGGPLISIRSKVELYTESIQDEDITNINTGDGELSCLSLDGKGIHSIQHTDMFGHLKWASFENNLITSIEFLGDCAEIEELSLRNNILEQLHSCLTSVRFLVKLDLSRNFISSLFVFQKGFFPYLKSLNISSNMLMDLHGLENVAKTLEELFVSHNHIMKLDDISSIKNSNSLLVLDLSYNKIEKLKTFKHYVVYHLSKLEFLNGKYISEAAHAEAAIQFGGQLNSDYLFKHYTPPQMNCLTEMTLSGCSLHKIDLSEGILPSLKSLNLDNNCISQLWGLHMLPRLQILCLNNNQVSCFRSEDYQKPQAPSLLFPRLEVLFLANNKIQSMKPLKIGTITTLKALFLQGNELNTTEGLEHVVSLHELILDKNKLVYIPEETFSKMVELRELYLERNCLQSLFFLKHLKHLQRLFLSDNKINNCSQMKLFGSMDKLEELTLAGNPVCQKSNYYKQIIQLLPSLLLIDGCSLAMNVYK